MMIIDLFLKLATIPVILLLLPYFIIANNNPDVLTDHFYMLILGTIYIIGEVIFLFRTFRKQVIDRFAKQTTDE